MRRNKMVMWLGALLIGVSLVSIFILDDQLSAKVGEIVAVVTGIVGAIAIYIQFKKDKEIAEASFVNTLYYSFYDSGPGLRKVMHALESDRVNNTNLIKEQKYEDVVEYLQWCEMLGTYVKQGVINIWRIDDLFSYRFFLIINNKYIQDLEIVPNKEFFNSAYWVYKKWYDYNKKTNQYIIGEENSLHLSEGYDKHLEKIIKNLR